MKRLWRLTLAAVLALGLTACGGGAAPFDVETTARSLAETPGVFSETLEPLEEPVALAQYGLEEKEGVAVSAYHSTGATAEEVAVIRFGSREEAVDYQDWADSYLDAQRKTNRDYRPQEMPKLEKAVAERRGETFLILVCADYEAAQGCLEGSVT